MAFNKKWTSFLLFILVLFFAWIALNSTPVLHIKLSSEVQGTSQLFYKKNHLTYPEAFSLQVPLKTGEQTLSFKPDKFHPSLRWDPINHAGTLLVENIWIQTYKIPFNIDLGTLRPNEQIATMKQTEKGLLISTTAKATDPQIFFRIPMAGIYSLKYTSIALTLIMAVLFLFSMQSTLLTLKRKLFPDNNTSAEFFQLISNTLQARSCFSLQQFAIFFAITYVFYGYFLTHFSLSIDSEFGVFRAASENAGLDWIGQGRWLCYFLERYVLTQPVVPYVPNLLFCFCITLSYLFILSAYKLQNRFLTYVTYPLFCAFPIWFFLLAFYANIMGTAVGILLVSIAIFIFSIYKNTFPQIHFTQTKYLFPFCIQALLLAMALGTYQAFLPVYVALGLGLILLNQTITPNRKELFSTILYLGSVAVLGLLLYSAINLFALWLVPSNTAYIDSFMNWQGLFKQPLRVITLICSETLSYYSGSTPKYGGSLSFVGVLLIATSSILIARLRKRTNDGNILNIILWVIVLITPFALNFISTGSIVPTRSLLAVPCVIWIAAIIGYTLGRGFAKIGILVIVLILEFQILQVMGLYVAATEIVAEHDRTLAASLYERIGALSSDGCNDTPCKVDVFGLSHVTTPYPVAWSSTMGASFFEWDAGNIYRMLAFMRLLGYTNLVAEPNQQNTPIFEKMPVWPAAGSVIKSNDVYLVKLSDSADPQHSSE